MEYAGRILIIDDNPAIHEDFRKVFAHGTPGTVSPAETEFFGETARAAPSTPQYRLDFASQGEEGLQMVKQAIADRQPHSLAFVDMRMPPGWDGIQTVRRIWEVHPGLQIVICSAYSDYSWKEIVENLGISDRLLVLKKPFDNVEVLQAAASLCAKRRLEVENNVYRTQLESKVNQANSTLKTSFEQLNESKKFLQSSLDALTAQVAILDGTGNLLFRNAAWTAATSPLVQRTLQPGENYLNFCESIEGDHAEVAQKLRAGIDEVTRSLQDSVFLEYQDKNEGYSSYYTARVSRSKTDGPVRIVVMHEDVSDYKQLQAKLVQALKLESMGQLSAGIAHEINSPMQYIGDNIDCLRDTLEEVFAIATPAPEHVEKLNELNNRSSASIEDCVDGFERVATIIRAMKELSHPGKAEKEMVDLARIIESAKTITRNRWKYNATLELDLPEQLPPAYGYAAELNQVFLNMIVNASDAIVEKYGNQDQRGGIRISAEEKGKEISIAIADNGCGIPQDIIDRVFDPFFTTKEVGQGTGQGLAISYDVIVNKHGGRLEVESTPGEGTCFCITLPKFQPESVTLPPTANSQSPDPFCLAQDSSQDLIG